MKGRERETFVAGPRFMNKTFNKAIEVIIQERVKKNDTNPTFTDIKDALSKIKDDFCVIEELKGIYNLVTSNLQHHQNVSDHTIQVVKNLENNDYYNELSKGDKLIVKLAAYFHDIGKGPKSKWKDGIQPQYDDHPADAISMVVRILVEEFISISEDEIKKICLLVFYHDLIGDIINKGRSKEELLKLHVDENELNMLIAISIADASSIKDEWGNKIKINAPQLKEEILADDKDCAW